MSTPDAPESYVEAPDVMAYEDALTWEPVAVPVSDSPWVCMEPGCKETATKTFTATMPRIDVPMLVKACSDHHLDIALRFAAFGGACIDFHNVTREEAHHG